MKNQTKQTWEKEQDSDLRRANNGKPNKAMRTQKWFYPLQDESEKMVTEIYERQGFCNYQDVTKDRVYENWSVIRKTDNKPMHILVVMHRETNFIFIYECQ